MLLSSAHSYHQSSSESGDSLSDSFLDTDASREGGTHNEKGLKAGDFSFGLGHSPYISALDQDHVFPFEQRNESIMREIFLSSQSQDEQGHLPNVDYFRPELHPPSQFRSKSLHSGDMQHTSRLNHHTHNTLPSLPQLITANLDSAVDTSMLMSNMGHAPEPNSATTSSSTESTHRQSEPWSDSARDSQNDHIPRARKPRREKPRIELAPDQPPTTQGKPRSRVYVACVQCRTRKIRCDGAKPTCHNCSRRSTNGGATCSYDSAPKRRGPDKTPGARQRTARDTNQGDADTGTVRRRRRKPETASPSKSDVRNTSRTYATDSSERQSPADVPSPVSSIPLTPSPLSDEPSKTWSGLVPARGFTALSRARPTLDNAEQKPFSPYQDYQEPSFSFIGGLTRGFIDRDYDDEERKMFGIVAEPSLDFTRKTWWDSLLIVYSSSSALDPLALTNSQRENAASHITSDLRFLFRASNYWFSFFHVPRFFATFCNPSSRDHMQPSLILAACALATFWQSSEIGKGKSGRDFALRLRDLAESALQGSLNAGWIDETLAQAAWILALFEICAHPLHSTQRSTSSMVMLDQIIHTLSLTSIDSDDPSASVFPPRGVPRICSEQKPTQKISWTVPSQSISDTPQALFSYPAVAPESHDTHQHLHESSPEPVQRTEHCNCAAMSLGHQWPSAFEHTPLWLSTPAWDENWSEGEIRKESCRRLSWSSVILAAGHSSYTTAYKANGLELFITDPANYRLLFPGEALVPSHHCKDSIWALNYRTMLLWLACVRMRHDFQATDLEKADFGMAAWLEVDALEEALNNHSCGLERAFLFQGREYLFNTRMCVSYEFQRYIPLATVNVRGMFHRKKAEEWLTHQATVAKQVMHGLHTVTGLSGGGSLIQRPFFVFWFMSQISRALSLWSCDKSLRVALDVSRALLVPIDYLTALWPCPEQRTRYERLREQLDQACIFAGLPLPDPPNLTLPASPRASILTSTPSILSGPPTVPSLSWRQNYETAYVRTTDIA